MKITKIILLVVFAVLQVGCTGRLMPKYSPGERAAYRAAAEEHDRLKALIKEGKPISEEEREWLSEHNRKLAQDAANAQRRRELGDCH